MKRLLTILLLFLSSACFAQVNLVKNPSFESYRKCPDRYDQISFANYWSGIDTNWIPDSGVPAYLYCLPEYCNTCSDDVSCSVPNNVRFYQYPRTGKGMAQAIMYFSVYDPFERDYLQGKLSQPLTAGTTYCISFYVNFEGFEAIIPSGYAIDHIGAYIDDGSIAADTGLSCAKPKPTIMPQIYASTIITDTLNWTKVQGHFIATGTEKFITIGNFFDKAHTNYVKCPDCDTIGYPFSLYLIDDVSVIASDEVAHAGSDVGIGRGDSVHIGTYEEGMPCTWYIAGSSVPIGYSGGLWVRPDTNTMYVVELDLCGNVTRDSVQVTVWPTGIKPVDAGNSSITITPNPAYDALTVTGAAGCKLTLTDMVGREVFHTTVVPAHEGIDISGILPGLYMAQVVMPDGGRKLIRLAVQ